MVLGTCELNVLSCRVTRWQYCRSRGSQVTTSSGAHYVVEFDGRSNSAGHIALQVQTYCIRQTVTPGFAAARTQAGGAALEVGAPWAVIGQIIACTGPSKNLASPTI